VRVLDEKLVAGFQAVVLEADSANALSNWLQEHGYAFSPEVEAWAKPYVDAGWKITALKVAGDEAAPEQQRVAAAALRMTFKTDRPLFPYREPDTSQSAEALEARNRLLRIYFIADARYEGELTEEVPWTGRVAWSDKITAEDRQKVLDLLKLPDTSGPADWWLTEFEDNWPYQTAPADLHFARSSDQSTVKRPPTIEYVSSSWTDVTVYALVGVRAQHPWRPATCIRSANTAGWCQSSVRTIRAEPIAAFPIQCAQKNTCLNASSPTWRLSARRPSIVALPRPEKVWR
jgi:hypothetical protein